jgi:beta-N-acetylhexosaminidase
MKKNLSIVTALFLLTPLIMQSSERIHNELITKSGSPFMHDFGAIENLDPEHFDIPNAAAEITKSLNLDEKIGQLFMVTAVTDETFYNKALMLKKQYAIDRGYVASLIEYYHVGGVIWLGTSTPEVQHNRTKYFSDCNAKRKSRPPLWFAQDLEPSFMERFGFETQPSASEIGAQNNASYTTLVAAEIGILARMAHVNLVLAPVADIHIFPESSITKKRAFGSEPSAVARQVIAFADGIKSQGVAACGKHFPGHGNTEKDSHHDLPVIKLSAQEMEETALVPFVELIQKGIPVIMTGHLVVPAYDPSNTPATLSRPITTGLLREKLGFNGLIVTDALDMAALNAYDRKEVRALKAGADLLLCSPNVPQAIMDIKEALKTGELSMAEIDAHVSKIIATKLRYSIRS